MCALQGYACSKQPVGPQVNPNALQVNRKDSASGWHYPVLMHLHDLRIHLESQRNPLLWCGSSTSSTEANSSVVGQVRYSQLGRVGEATLNAYGVNRYTLVKEGTPLPGNTVRPSLMLG